MPSDHEPTIDGHDEAAAGDHAAPVSEPDATEHDAGLDPSDLSIALTPKQIIGGFALLAALVMLLRRRDRDRRHD